MKSPYTLMKGAVLLTGATLIVKILSAVYRIPFQNFVGDHGLYVYQQVYPFYAFALTLALYGFPVMLSRWVSEYYSQGQKQHLTACIQQSFLFMVIVCGLGFFLSFYFASPLAHLMGDPHLKPLIQMSAFFFLFLPLLSVLRGYFQGIGDMLPTAVSQVIEQIIRVTAILMATMLLYNEQNSIYTIVFYACMGAVFAFVSSTIFLLSYAYKHHHFYPVQVLFKKRASMNVSLFKPMMLTSIAVCISSLFYIAFQFIDALTFVPLLAEKGFLIKEAQLYKGVYDRAQPLIQLGTVVSTAFSLTIVPLVAAAKAKGAEDQMKAYATYAIRISVMTGLGASVGLMGIIGPTNVMLFKTDAGSLTLGILGLAILGNSLSMTTAAILQGLGKMYIPVIYVVIGIGLKYCLNLILIPVFFEKGAAIATVVSFFMTAALQWLSIEKALAIRSFRFTHVRTYLSACFWMSVALVLYRSIFSTFISDDVRILAACEALFGVLIGAVVYVSVLLKKNVFTEKELLLIPKGRYLVKWMKRLQHKKKVSI